MATPEISNIFDYMRRYAGPMGKRILESYPPLHAPGDPVSPFVAKLKRKPLAAQTLAIMGVAKYLKDHDAAKIVAEMGCGKTLMSLAACYVHANGRQFTGITMCPSHLPLKWSREIFLTIPNTRVFLVDGMRNLDLTRKEGETEAEYKKKLSRELKKHQGVVEVRLNKGKVERRGETFTLAQLRQMGRKGFLRHLGGKNAFFVISKERGKLGYFWRPSWDTAKSGKRLGYAINPDSGLPVEISDGGRLTAMELLGNKKYQEMTQRGDGKAIFSAMWSADNQKIPRMAPLEFMGRYMHDFFDYGIADELHQLSGDTAQGNGLAILARIARKIIGLTGTLISGYADDTFNLLFRMDGPQMAREGYAWGHEGRVLFQSTFGVREEIVKRESDDAACTRRSKSKVIIKRKPGCSPVLFGKFLMENTAFVSLEDIANDLPSYNEYPVPVAMDADLAQAYKEIEDAIKEKLQEYPKNPSLTSMMMQTLLCYPDHPFDFKMLKAKVWTSEGMDIINVVKPQSLLKDKVYAKEQALIDEIRQEIAEGRRVQVFATFTGEHDVTHRLETVLAREGFRVAVMKSSVPTERREEWYADRVQEGVQVIICHPKLVETGLDLLDFPTILFYETGYSLFTLRQASRRSWRIGQKHPVRVKFFFYENTAQEKCVKLMGKKLLVSLVIEGKSTGEGLDNLDADDDMMTAMVRELLEEGGVGESADDIWKNLERERAIHTTAYSTPEPTIEEVDAVLDTIASDSDLASSAVPSSAEEIAQEVIDYANSASDSVVMQQNGLASFAAKSRGRRAKVDTNQLSLF